MQKRPHAQDAMFCRGLAVSHSHPGRQACHAINETSDLASLDCFQFRACTGEPKLEIPITGFYGSQDRRITKAMVQGWAAHTSASFDLIQIEGHHLWPTQKEAKAGWLQHIVQVCEQLKADR